APARPGRVQPSRGGADGGLTRATAPHFEGMTMRLSFGAVAGLALVYFVAAMVGLHLASLSPSATPVWPPTGIAFAACRGLGRRVWPAIFAGAFLATLATTSSVPISLGIAAGNTLEALVGAYLVTRLANGPKVFDQARDIFGFVALAALAST